MNEKLIDDVAIAASLSIVEMFMSILGDNTVPLAFAEIHARVIAAVECYEIKRDRPNCNLSPSVN